MKKILTLSLVIFAFACGDANNKTGATGADKSVEIGSGEEVSPQLEIESDTASELKVDTVTSPEAANQGDQ